MAATQQYSLRWNNYFRHLTYALDNHRNNDDLVDVSLCCDGRKIKAHKVVLSSCSSYFKEIFKENPHPHPVIIFKFIKFEDLNSIVEFMYQGEVNVQQEALQSFLQTAELLAVQGLTAEEKEKPRAPPVPIIDERKLMKTIPSTIRAITETGTATTQTTSQTIEIPAGTLIQTQTASQQQTQQLQHIQIQQPHPTHIQQANHHQHAAQQQQTQHTVVTGTLTLPGPGSTIKKRKITFSDVDDDNLYTTETVDYAVKDEQSLVKATEMAFLHRAVKMDMPTEYIVSDVDESQHLSDSNTQPNSQDNNAEVGQSVAQYTSEYEILTESEIEEKYHQGEADNTEITIDMGRLMNSTPNTGNTAAQSGLEDTNVLASSNSVVTSKADGAKSGSSTNLPSNKWTECELCKMVITTVNLWRHIRTQHTPQPPRKCDLCNKNFKNKYSLREHIRISHEQKLADKAEN